MNGVQPSRREGGGVVTGRRKPSCTSQDACPREGGRMCNVASWQGRMREGSGKEDLHVLTFKVMPLCSRRR